MKLRPQAETDAAVSEYVASTDYIDPKTGEVYDPPEPPEVDDIDEDDD